jgi:hypothetical protein
MTTSGMKTTRRREIIHEPSRGRKVAKGFGIAILCLAIFGAFIVAAAIQVENATSGDIRDALFVIFIMLVISALLIYAGRRRKEVIIETVEDDDQGEGEERIKK